MTSVASRILAGDREAYGEVYREFQPRLLGLCQYLLSSHDEAEDASSEVFVRLPVALRTYDTSLPFSRWLTSVAGHYCIDLLRRRRSEQLVFQLAGPDQREPAAATVSALEELLADEDRRAVRAAIARLPEHYSVPLVMRFYRELSYDEIAQRLSISRNNAKTLVFRAKEKLRRLLSKGKNSGRRQIPKPWIRRTSQALDASGKCVICETRSLPSAVIPAKAGIYSASRGRCPADRLDSRLRGNDWCFERDAIPNDTTTAPRALDVM